MGAALANKKYGRPPYTATVMSDAQLADVWAYIKTIPESPPAKSIPLLSQMLSEK